MTRNLIGKELVGSFEHQVYAFKGLFYEPYQNASYYGRRYLNPKTLNWNNQ